MKTKILYVTILALSMMGCSTTDHNTETELVSPSPEVDYLRYMQSLPVSNANCLQEDYIYLNIDGEEIEYYYNNPSNGLLLCNFNEGNVSGVMCLDCEGHYSSLPFPLAYGPYFPNLPIGLGTEYPVGDETKIITEIVSEGLDIRFSIPSPLIDNIVPGPYRLSQSFTDPGVSVQINWSIGYDGGYSGYTLALSPTQPYLFELECVDTSAPNVIRLTGNFEGNFVSHALFNATSLQYSIPIQGRFSYAMTRN